MSFSPVPATFTDDLRRSAPLGVLELGSGDGSFTTKIREAGCDPVTLDRRVWPRGPRPRIRGAALQPPLRRRFDVVVAANLLRQLWSALPSQGPVAWRDLVAPGGSLWIFEDEPLAAPPMARHYRDLQALLARDRATERRPLLSLAEFRRRRDTWVWPGTWQQGIAPNRWPAATGEVTAWLASGRPAPQSEMARLLAAIERDGLSYGDYWWACWRPEARG